MPTAMTTRIFRSSLVFAAIVVLLTSSGCVGVVQRVEGWCYGLSVRSQQKHELADIRQDTRLALAEQEREALRLAAEREVQAARLDAQRRQWEMEFCQANQEALQRRIQSNLRETVESKVAFNVEQGLEVGELEVDVEQLQALLKRREQQPPTPELPLRKRPPCACCDMPCGCEPGLIRRHCPRCRHKPCEAEISCGGPEALARVEELPLRRPLRPAEIPMKLPVRLSFGFQQPAMEQALIRRVPNIELPLERPPCDRCPGGHCPDGHYPYPCTQPAPQAGVDPTHDYLQAVPTQVPTIDTQTGPMPVPEAEAAHWPAPNHASPQAPLQPAKPAFWNAGWTATAPSARR